MNEPEYQAEFYTNKHANWKYEAIITIGALTFVEALKVNRTLTNLELSNNKIKNPETVKALVAAAAAGCNRSAERS